MSTTPAPFTGPGVDLEPDDVDELEPPRRSALDELRDMAEAPLAAVVVTYEVPTRPGWSVRYSAGMDGEKIRHWAKRATTGKGNAATFDQTLWASLVLGAQAEAILKDGQNPTESGDPVKFSDEAWLELAGTRRVADAVRLFYGGTTHIGDGHLVAQAYALIKAAGYDEDGVKVVEDNPLGLDEENPTERS